MWTSFGKKFVTLKVNINMFKTGHQSMSLMEKTEFPFFLFLGVSDKVGTTCIFCFSCAQNCF